MSHLTHTKPLRSGDGTRPTATDAIIRRASIRVSPNSYLVALVLGTFFSSFLFYLEIDIAGFVLFALSWVVLPFLALNDRITFDGKRLSRTGLCPIVWSWFFGTRLSLKLNDVEQIETQAIRALKRGGNIYYRYRTTVRGRGIQISFASGGDDYRRMINAILPGVSENGLDNRSIELRDHLADPKETLIRAESEHIPSADFLRGTIKSRDRRAIPPATADPADVERAETLRDLGNQLRLNGYLLQALEVFRRALVVRPRDGRLIFEFARCLQSIAGTERSDRLERKAIAAMRLAEMRADADGDLLARLGEAYFQAGEWRRAARAFQKALDRVGEGFRSARGLAEIALREGKIAHVIHHFSTANRLAETPSLRRWTRGEADYYSRLNDDDEYMEMEIGRVNLIETLERSKKTTLRIALIGFPVIVFGVMLEDDLIANVGWAVSTVGLIVWTGLIISVRMLAPRINYELLESDDD